MKEKASRKKNFSDERKAINSMQMHEELAKKLQSHLFSTVLAVYLKLLMWVCHIYLFEISFGYIYEKNGYTIFES